MKNHVPEQLNDKNQKKEGIMKLYLAGSLFNAGERLHLLYLEKHLKALGIKVVLPQREALKFFDGNKFNTKGIREECRNMCADKENLFVGCIDGPDADSGTSIEYGIAIESTGRAIVYRTDFRTDISRELGVNGMFDAMEIIYQPCFFTSLNEADAFYEKLAQKIYDVAQVIQKMSESK